jgi:predicted membrane-bound mannosyltransferase
MAITERHSRFIRVLILIAAFGFAALYFDIRYSVLPFGDGRPLYYLFAVLLFAILMFWYDLKYSKEDPTLKKAIVWGLDLPLVVGFAFIMFFTGKLMQTQVILPQEASLFIGGAMAFKLGYYHAGYSFLKVSFR